MPKMSVTDVALATVVSIAYMVPLEAYFLKKISLTPLLSLRPSHVVKVVKAGLPAAEKLVFSVGNNAYIAFIARCGNVALAAPPGRA